MTEQLLKKGEDHIGVTIVYYCHDGKGNVLMAQRSTNSRDEHDRWDIGAGAVEFGERVEDVLRREIMEEYLTDVLDFEFLGFRDVHRIHRDKPTHWIALDFKVLVDSAKVGNGEPHKHQAVQWFPKNDYPENTHSQWPYFLEKYKERL
jgi:8-oxo-dGTP diphosphatase